VPIPEFKAGANRPPSLHKGGRKLPVGNDFGARVSQDRIRESGRFTQGELEAMEEIAQRSSETL